MNLSGRWKIRVKANDVTGKVSYRTSIVQRDLEGNTDFYTIFLNLVKDAKNMGITDGQYIVVEPEDAWLGFYKKDNETHLVANVKRFSYADEDIEMNVVDTNDDLPF